MKNNRTHRDTGQKPGVIVRWQPKPGVCGKKMLMVVQRVNVCVSLQLRCTQASIREECVGVRQQYCRQDDARLLRYFGTMLRKWEPRKLGSSGLLGGGAGLEAVLGSTGDVLEVAHASGTGSFSALRLLSPLV